MTLSREVRCTPETLTSVVNASRTTPSSTAFAAPVGLLKAESPPRIWKPDQIGGSTACNAIAAAARVTT